MVKSLTNKEIAMAIGSFLMILVLIWAYIGSQQSSNMNYLLLPQHTPRWRHYQTIEASEGEYEYFNPPQYGSSPWRIKWNVWNSERNLFIATIYSDSPPRTVFKSFNTFPTGEHIFYLDDYFGNYDDTFTFRLHDGYATITIEYYQ